MTILVSPKTTTNANRYLERMISILYKQEHTTIAIRSIPLSLLWYRIVRGTRVFIAADRSAQFWMTIPSRLLGIRVYWVEDRLVDRSLSGGWTRLWYRFLSRFATIITAARMIKKQLEDMGVARDRIHAIVPGIDADQLGVQRTLFSSLAEERGKRRIGFSIGTVAELEREKGIEYLLQAFKIASAHIPNLHLTIVGHGPLKQELQWLAKKLQITEHVLFVGWQEQHERWIQGFDLIVMPHTRKEKFSDILLTAMACERPIIATDVGTFPEMIEKRKTGMIIEPNNATMMAEAMLNLYHHPDWRLEMGKLARQRVLEHYSIERMERALESLIR